MRYPHLLSPFQLNQLTLRNRIVSTAHAEVYAEEGGLPGETLTEADQSAYDGQSSVYASRFIARYTDGNGLLSFVDGHAEMLPWQNVVGTASAGKSQKGHAILPQPGETDVEPHAEAFNPGTSLSRVVWTANPNDPGDLLP